MVEEGMTAIVHYTAGSIDGSNVGDPLTEDVEIDIDNEGGIDLAKRSGP